VDVDVEVCVDALLLDGASVVVTLGTIVPFTGATLVQSALILTYFEWEPLTSNPCPPKDCYRPSLWRDSYLS
jgi:hypothetical protein